MEDVAPPTGSKPHRFTDELRISIRRHGLSYATEKTYVNWILRFIRFHGRRHPRELGGPEVEAFLCYLAEDRNCAIATQRVALNALVFLFQRHLGAPLGELSFRYAKRARRVPTVLSHDEAIDIIGRLTGTRRTIGALLYGSGLRLSEALRLRIKDIDFAHRQIVVIDGKGRKSRNTLLPASLADELDAQVANVENLHRYDLGRGYG